MTAATSATAAVHVLASTPTHPRQSEGAFVTLQDGDILFAWSRFTGNSDDAPAEITAIRSTDQGRRNDDHQSGRHRHFQS